MGIILLELPDSSQSTQRPGSFIPMQNTKVRDPHWKLAVAPIPMAKENKVGRAVHWLQGKLLFVDDELKHVVPIMLPVTRPLPEINIIHVWCLHFLISPFLVFRAQERLESIEDLGSIGKKERRPRGNIVKEEQLLLLANPQMVAFLGFF